MRFSPKARLLAAVTGVFAVAATGAGVYAYDLSTKIEFASDYGPDDGLNRFVLTMSDPVGDTLSSVGADAATLDFSSLTSSDIGGDGSVLDLALLSKAQNELGANGNLLVEGDKVLYVKSSQAMVVSKGGSGEVVSAPASAPVETGAPSAPPVDATPIAPEDEPVPVEPEPVAEVQQFAPVDPVLLAALSERPGVETVQTLDNNQVLISSSLELTNVEGFDEVRNAERSVSVPVLGGGVTDPYWSSYGWNLKNTGSNAYQQTAVAGADANVPAGWETSRGQDTVVAVVDTGFDSDHPDLLNSLWNNPTEACGNVDTNGNGKAGDCHGWNFYNNSSNIDNGTYGSHGTTVSGVIAAGADNGVGSAGVAPMTKIMPLVVGAGENVDVLLAAQAFRYAADNGADVINASFGGEFTGSALTALTEAVDYARSKGVLVIAAAGNDAGNRDVSKVYPASLTNSNIITVGSTTAADTVAATSAYGATSVDLFAPGDKVFTTWNDGGFRLVSGTSIAAPHVAAAVAMYRSVNPSAGVTDTKAAILASVKNLSVLNGKAVTGGRLDTGKLSPGGANPNETISYSFNSMVSKPGTVKPEVEISSTASTGTYTARVGLAMLYEGEVWAVSDQPITLNGSTVSTDQSGTSLFTLSSGTFLSNTTLKPTMALGEGSYALIVQVLKNGEPMSRPYAAPLIVSAAADPGTGGGTNPGGTDPGDGGTDPGTGGTDPGTGGTDPGTGGGTNPGTGGGTDPGTGGGTDPGTGGGTSPGGTDPGSGGTDPGTGGGTDPGTGGGTDPGAGGGTDPGTGGGTNPGSGGTDPGTGGTDPGTGGTDPGTGGTDPGTGGGTDPSTPAAPDTKYYDAVGDFQITAITPTRINGEGGQVVSIRGNALESGVGVRVGSRPAESVSVLGNQLYFTAPAAVEGIYDVVVYKNGRSSTLADAVTYYKLTDPGDGGTDPGTGGGTNPGDGGTDPGTGGTDPGTGGGSAPGGTDPGTGGTNPGTGGTNPGTGGGTSPGGSTPGGSTPTNPGGGTDPGGSTPTTPTTPNATKVGPNGEKLVRNDALSSLSSLWSLDCSSRCSGMQV